MNLSCDLHNINLFVPGNLSLPNYVDSLFTICTKRIDSDTIRLLSGYFMNSFHHFVKEFVIQYTLKDAVLHPVTIIFQYLGKLRTPFRVRYVVRYKVKHELCFQFKGNIRLIILNVRGKCFSLYAKALSPRTVFLSYRVDKFTIYHLFILFKISL